MEFVVQRKSMSADSDGIGVVLMPKRAEITVVDGGKVSEAYVKIDELASWSHEAREMVRRALLRRAKLHLDHYARTNPLSLDEVRPHEEPRSS